MEHMNCNRYYELVKIKQSIMTYRPIARQRLGKHIPAQAYARNNRTSIAKQRTSQHASLTTEAVFSASFLQNGYKEVFGSIEQSRVESSFETPACQDMSFGAEDLNLVESSELAAAE
jgi:hypothetical protein